MMIMRVYSKDEEVEKMFHCSFPFTQEAHCFIRQRDRQNKRIIHVCSLR